MSNDQTEDRRRHYRLAYPLTARPSVRLADGKTYVVLDSSAGGVRIRVDKDWPMRKDPTVTGSIKLCSGATVEFRGRALAVADRIVAVIFEPGAGLSDADILAEQRWLKTRFPHRR